MYDKLKIELIYFKSKGDDGREVLKPANFMFAKTDDLHNYVMPVPMNMKLVFQLEYHLLANTLEMFNI
jgi:hypothetical protein